MKSMSARLNRAEDSIGDALLWEEALKIAAESGQSPQAIYDDAKETYKKYQHLEVPLPNGNVDLGPMLRAIAEGEGFDYEELIEDVKRLIRREAARERRAAKRHGH